MKNYYEAHITMEGDPQKLRPVVESVGWKFSCIEGDINLGDGVKCYATRQFNARVGDERIVQILNGTADGLASVAKVLRRKVELVIYDDRSSLVRPCDGACPECVG